MRFPPYAYLTLFRAESKNARSANEFLKTVVDIINAYLSDTVKNREIPLEIWGPIPAIMERKATYFRSQILLQTPCRNRLQALLRIIMPKIHALKNSRKIRWYIDVDPEEIG